MTWKPWLMRNAESTDMNPKQAAPAKAVQIWWLLTGDFLPWWKKKTTNTKEITIVHWLYAEL